MRIKRLNTKNFKTSKWSGGTTTELYIYPLESNYKDLDFKFRISTAKVELEKSNFTSLKGISRKLMIIDGGIEIHHKNRYSKKLSKFDIDNFEGDWETSSEGKCQDFNVMTSKGISSRIFSIELNKDESKELFIDTNSSHYIIYCISNLVSFKLMNKAVVLRKGELLVIDEINNLEASFFIQSKNQSNLIIVEIKQA